MSFYCPHCGIAQIITDKAFSRFANTVHVGKFAEMVPPDKAEHLHVSGTVVSCANPACMRLTVDVALSSGRYVGGYAKFIEDSTFVSKRLYPGAVGKPFPDHVPAPMFEDYQEAWSIIELSPKSSATLARRCLQGMIRDFCGIKKRTLYDEIEALRLLANEDRLPRGVDADTIEAMLALKDVGNIGAHMSEIDGVVLEVDPGEAQKLLSLIEMLFADWYVARGKRAERIAAVLKVAGAKKPKSISGDSTHREDKAEG
ncbi:DUF4145 domain-containing protein [Sphingomonas sp. MMS12-HWE2-04]|uniref:DUF4145 domain-containing protein n=1 Tax=Sphingomonas sp. MMS12-HWE2-04 TaxID=3234199 RepID=UPI00385113A0